MIVKLISTIIAMNLTLTSVVFEYHREDIFSREFMNLTLTSVVFESTLEDFWQDILLI